MNHHVKQLSKQLYIMTWPMIIGLLAIMTNQLVDSAFIGQLGAKPLAAVGFTIPIYQLIIGVQVGLGIATTTVIAMALGEKKEQYASQLGFLVISFGFLLVLILCQCIYYFKDTIVLNLGASQNLLPTITSYWLPWLISCWFGAMLYFGCSIFRAHGKTFLPGMIMVITSVLNIIIDPILIFTFKMGLSGAAWASTISLAVGCIIVYKELIKLKLINIPYQFIIIRTGFKNLMSFMLPSMMSQFMPSLSALIALSIVAFYGEIAVATWGLGTRLEYFSIIIILALTMALPPMIGKMKGLGDIESIHKLTCIAVTFVLALQLVIATLLIYLSQPISNLLTTDSSVIDILTDYLWIVPISYSGLGVCMITVSVCSAMGAPKLALLISVLRLLACYLPLLWLGSEIAGLPGLFIGAAAGNFSAGLTGWYIYKKSFNNLQKNVQYLNMQN